MYEFLKINRGGGGYPASLPELRYSVYNIDNIQRTNNRQKL